MYDYYVNFYLFRDNVWYKKIVFFLLINIFKWFIEVFYVLVKLIFDSIYVLFLWI